jgi:hypothetical protein
VRAKAESRKLKAEILTYARAVRPKAENLKPET